MCLARSQKEEEESDIRHHRYHVVSSGSSPTERLTCYRLGASAFACTDHNQELHDIIIDLITAALHDEDILAADGCIDIN